MPFREKSAWIALVAMVLCYGAYFALAARHPQTVPTEPATVANLALFGAATIAQVVIMVVAHIAVALAAPQDARAKPDERDRAILRRSYFAAYHVLLAGMIIVGCVMPFNAGGWRIINAALLTIVAAEVVRHLTIISSYRRGWHG